MNYKFCFRCGGEFEKKSSEFFICNSCGHHHYLNPKPCNAVIIYNDKNEILLVERGVDPKKGMWDLPGGFITIKESIEDSVRREVKEELDINVTELKYVTSTIDKYMYMNEEYDTLCSIFSAKMPTDQTIEVKDDAASYRFFKPDEIPFDKIAFPSLVRILKNIS